MAYYIPKFKTLFLHISKAGGTSVENWLLNNFNVNKFYQKHCRIDVAKEHNLNFDMHFTIVRNPFARIHSWYYYHIQGGPHKEILDNWPHWKVAKELGFNKWLELEFKEGSLKNSIWWTQKSFIDVNLPHMICRLEHIPEDFKKVQNYLNCHKPLRITNNSNHDHYKNDYNTLSKKIIKRYFREDLEYFNYDF
jgi:hypothetical protein